ncbi:unnamed protein product [Prorocentrum cordatum]|uniref:Uncharacterized protein n=1 Tax=Prorocentrum cordatum TaxID=2364126 RepID=A0ABN9UHV1_9DINO|nr:unnamed protein product [Polarella glacialis]
MAQSGSVHWSSVPSAEDLAGDVGESAFGVCSGAASGGASGSRTSNRGAEPLRPQRIELPSYLNTPARRPGGEPLSDQEQMVALKRIQDLELLAQACRRSSKGKEEGRAHFSLGVMRDNLGHYQKAIESYNHSCECARRVGTPRVAGSPTTASASIGSCWRSAPRGTAAAFPAAAGAGRRGPRCCGGRSPSTTGTEKMPTASASSWPISTLASPTLCSGKGRPPP